MEYTVPVNPEYDWSLTPQEQADFVNPVELNNKLLDFQNEHARATLKVVACQKLRSKVKVALRSAENDLTKFRNRLLRQFPPSKDDRKTNVLLEAFIDRIAFEHGKEAELSQLLAVVTKLEDEQTILDGQIESGKTICYMLQDFYENIKTHLAFRKHEERQSAGAPGA